MILTTDSRIIGIDSKNKQVRLCRFEVDEISELPAPDVWTSDGVIICMGSTAHVIGDNSEHMLDSSGQWVQQVAGTSSYTRAEIDALMLDKVNTSTYATDKAAIDAEIATLTPAAIKAVDEGAKNLVNAPSGSGVRYVNIPIVLEPGCYYVLFQNISSTDTDAATCQFGAFAEDDTQSSNFPQLVRGNNTGSMFTVTKQTAYVRLYASNSFANGGGDTVTFTGCMICTAADWAVSQKFVPYCPTLYELYQMILAL